MTPPSGSVARGMVESELVGLSEALAREGSGWLRCMVVQLWLDLFTGV